VLEGRIPRFVGVVGLARKGQLGFRQVGSVLNNRRCALRWFIDTFLGWIRNVRKYLALTYGCDNGGLDGNCRCLDLAQEFVKAGVLVK